MDMNELGRPGAGWQSGTARLVGLTGITLAVLLGGCQKKEAAEDAAPAAAAEAATAAPAGLEDDAAKASYTLGYIFTENLKRQFGDGIELEAFLSGARDQLTGVAAKLDDKEAERVLNAMVEQRQAAASAEASANLDAGLKFLEDNGKREGVVTLESGLQYEVLQAGTGDQPGAEDVVTTNYEGRLIDGTVFDSSYTRGEPATFPLNRVIAGWTEGLQLMAPGAKYRLYVPAGLGYGDRAAGSIPPNSTLIFEVELLKIEPAAASADPAAPAEQ